MNEILHIWDTIVKTNTFNFAVMIALLWWICKKFNIGGILENAKQNVINSIEKSKEEKAAAKEKAFQPKRQGRARPQTKTICVPGTFQRKKTKNITVKRYGKAGQKMTLRQICLMLSSLKKAF